MKKLFLAAALFMATLSLTSAKDIDESAKAKAAFSKVFLGVTNAKWKITGEYIIATFNINGSKMKAFYDVDGNLVSTTRVLTSTKELPQNALDNIQASYPGWGITELIEESGREAVPAFYARITDGSRLQIIKIHTSGKISVFKKE